MSHILLAIVCTFSMLGCRDSQPDISPARAAAYEQALQRNYPPPPTAQEQRESERADSLTTAESLTRALMIADSIKDLEDYHVQTNCLNITYGHLFAPDQRHLVISSFFPWGAFENIYVLRNNSFTRVLHQELSPMVFLNDSVADINGDGLRDFLIHWYPAAGCCLRDVYYIFLLKTTHRDFADSVEVINPVFSPKERIVRGLAYGHLAPLYKYRWNGYRLDTIEYIFSHVNDSSDYYIRRKHNDLNEQGEVLRELPIEYQSVGY